MIIGSWISRAIYVAAKLRIADHLADGPRTAEELAAAAGVAPRPLYRLLRALAGVGVFAQEADGRFRLNPLAEPLREDGPDSLWAFAVMLGEEQYRCWGDLLETVRTGEPAFERLYGRPIFDYLGEHPEQARIFDAAMSGFSGRETQAMLDAYDLSGVATLADVGGGLGTNLARILGRYPAMRGLLFDLPHVVERARPVLEAAGVSGRCDVQGGDFFETVPCGADAYLLGHIIHDWDDAKAGLILDNLRRAMPTGARLLVVEYVLPEPAIGAVVRQMARPAHDGRGRGPRADRGGVSAALRRPRLPADPRRPHRGRHLRYRGRASLKARRARGLPGAFTGGKPYHAWVAGLVRAFPDMCEEIRSGEGNAARMITFEWCITGEW